MMHGFIPPDRYFAYLSWTDIDTMPDKENVVIVQPIGAIEQHGAHLPLAVDSAISVSVIGKALSQLDARIPAFALPPLYYGKSNEHWHFPGTITLSTQTLVSVLIDVAESVYRAGFRKLVFMNAHGGQPQILEIVARDLHQKYEDFAVFPLFVWKVPTIAAIARELLSEKELALGIHAGDAETSLLLSILPNHVNLDRAVTEYPIGVPQDSVLSIEGALPFAWMTRDLSRSGVIGDPSGASKEKGDRLFAALVEGWIIVIQDVYRFQLPQAWK